MPWPVRQKGCASRCSITSLAHTPSRSRPRRTKRAVSGTCTRTSRVRHALAMSVEPTPNAKQPSAPAMQVCESVPMTSCPGSASSSMTLLWQMASEPTSFPSRCTSPYSLMPWRRVNVSCTAASEAACSPRPSLRCASGITRSRNVRWSRNANTLAGSVTVASAPKPWRKSASAIGVTYSCEKRTSVRAKSASPGATAGTPTLPDAASVTACAAMIFSQSVMGRAAVSTGGGATSPASRARL